MNKTLLTISAVALSSGTAMAYETDVEVNNSYIKLASISPIVETDMNMVVSQNFDLSIPLDPDDPTDPDHPINESCIARGFDVVGGCNTNGSDCIEEYCPENNLYMQCTCFCSLNACEENDYYEQTCTKYQTEEDCPILPNMGYVKCNDMDDFEKCIVDEYYDSPPNCTGYKIAEKCPFDPDYEKCVDMDDEEKCIADGYTLSSCPSGEELDDKCPHGSENLYKSCKVSNCGSEFVTSCSAGYKLDTSNSCTDGSGTKYLCVAEECVGYDETSPCGSGYSESTCLSGTTTKYMCNPNDCTGFDETSPCYPVNGFTQTMCVTGSETKFKCVANDCTGYNETSSCSPADGYVEDTCQKGADTVYKCTPNACDGYTMTYCKPLFYSIIESCQKGADTVYKCTNDCEGYPYTMCPPDTEISGTCWDNGVKKLKCSKNYDTPEDKCKAEGYSYTSASNPYELTDQCPYDGSFYKRECKSATPTACKAAGYTKATGSCGNSYYYAAYCPCDNYWMKCVCDENKAAADGVACPK